MVAIDKACSLSGHDWFTEMKALCEDPALFWDRDYLLPLPTQDLEGCIRVPAESEDMRAFEMAMFEDLRVPKLSAPGVASVIAKSRVHIPAKNNIIQR